VGRMRLSLHNVTQSLVLGTLQHEAAVSGNEMD